MISTKVKTPLHLVVISGLVITLSLTSWVNVDALVIPKLILLFATGMYLLPILLLNLSEFKSNRQLRFLLLVCVLIAGQMILVLIVSNAPLEQQIFGRTGRGLGFLTEFSLLIVILVSARFISFDSISFVLNSILIATLISSIYSIFQKFGFDIFDWYTRTNGIIGTLGNPNFQSALAAMAIVPALSLYFKNEFKLRLFSIISLIILFYTIYICQSTQGYIIVGVTVSTFLLVFLWFSSRIIFYCFTLLTSIMGVVSLAGMINKGPLAYFLYKQSVTSRGEFMRTAITGAKDNPIFGVGLDSFGDVSTFYKSAKDASGINEFTDNAHNYFLQYAVNGGFTLMVLHFVLVIFTIFCFVKLQKRIGIFDYKVATLFSFWIGYLAQSFISPAAIPIIFWGSVITGCLIGLFCIGSLDSTPVQVFKNKVYRPFSYFLVFISLLITYPYFNVDRIQLKSLNTGDALLAVQSAKAYPESSIRYSRVGVKLLESNLPVQALEVGRAAVEFNPNSISSWALILANSSASMEERKIAQQEILRLDPFNDEIRSIVIPD